MSTSLRSASSAWLTSADCDLADFADLVSQQTDRADYPLAADVVQNVVVYSADQLAPLTSTPDGRRAVQAEIVHALSDGPGMVVFKGACYWVGAKGLLVSKDKGATWAWQGTSPTATPVGVEPTAETCWTWKEPSPLPSSTLTVLAPKLVAMMSA